LYFETLVPLGARLFEQLLTQLEQGARPSAPQDESAATYEPLRPPKQNVER
jgi:methionyl-tRNA formyltransferase